MSRHLAIIALMAAALCLAACRQPAATTTLRVVASIHPLADFARNVGGGRVQVTTLLPIGASPHTYEPTPAQVRDIAEASLFIKNGVGLEFWAERIVAAAANPRLLVVDTSRGVDLLAGDPEHDADTEGDVDHEHEGANPHFWLDPVLAQQQVVAIRDALVEADPDHRRDYEANAERYLKELQGLDAAIQSAVAAFSNRNFVSYHAAWSYFARRYGLVEAAIIEESPGREPTPAHIRTVIDTVRRYGCRAVFAEPQFSPQAAEAIASESGAQVLFLDPLGGPGLPDRDTYLKLMRYNLSQMTAAMR